MTTLLNAFIGIAAFWIINSVLVFVISAFCAGVLIPQILLISFRKQLFDIPDERKIHQGVVPRLGGIAFKPVVFFSVAFLLGISQLFGYGELLDGILSESRTLAFGFCAIMILYLVGIADDLIGVRYRAKFIIQICCGLMVIGGGLWINDLYGLLYLHEIPDWIGYILSLFAVVFIINAINLIDGIDGLASGLCGVAVLFYGVVFLLMHEYIYAMLSFATFGVLVPFFYFNVFGNPVKQKKIFMGDTGSLTVGMMICILSLRMVHHFPSDLLEIQANPFILAYSPLIIPCFDVMRVYLHRVKNGKNPFLPDKNHIHHKMLAIGMRQRTAMITIVFLSVCFTLCNILLSRYMDVTLLLTLDVAVWTTGNLWLTRRIRLIHSKL
ncbi:MraY family glycosyltransferase [Phocaeicola vulgatus]|uniref:MraY family glycosyltransferase n=1 Tax=Phocaeicola vulgatus TaxID=821 RepID=UPI001E44BE04|nr:MraY family glycosyltransferase [Phocaeicola vulgatus]BDC06848.1 undecaprenyl-phosphate alpha-N-acetylglucosaminyl 1-phosphate transferase [Phocaeicola vulgatus]